MRSGKACRNSVVASQLLWKAPSLSRRCQFVSVIGDSDQHASAHVQDLRAGAELKYLLPLLLGIFLPGGCWDCT